MPQPLAYLIEGGLAGGGDSGGGDSGGGGSGGGDSGGGELNGNVQIIKPHTHTHTHTRDYAVEQVGCPYKLVRLHGNVHKYTSHTSYHLRHA